MEKEYSELVKNYELNIFNIEDKNSVEFYEDDMNYLYELKIKGHTKYGFFREMGLDCFVKNYYDDRQYH